ncbi:2-hydroxy-3-keto-5-methylthiopentenyl-1-phosphate phosphatase [Bacillus timonensis]|uniref:2-hydroxy-3-keto-5-methylthiopentenyl-1-phosphate phosphatase n=1 Tax=Bacillus timonensis TaxID=1033734 RepID=A0A4S3PLY9_9BACI|nr:2-hydroxy-3-keto-5-methylthiopentenyl-1-phosphate phosphatase [Bacillus timonensis]THE09682.1 2-hydroxy-3-keto-5-methylthiopentenyl-1-phosphate phosphatase [Bacillus timonensis]
MNKPIIFCDFDGTITNTDNIIAIMKKFAPSGWEKIKKQVLSEEIPIQEGVSNMFSLLPSAWRGEITNYILNHAEIRDGFTEFVAFTKEQGIPLYIVSGGIDFFVEPLLEGLITKEQIYCNQSDFSNERINIMWPYTCDDYCKNECGCCKPSLIRKLTSNDHYKIVIGDSITDLQAAKLADKVIARDFLIKKCEELGIDYSSFHSFFDVIEILKKEVVDNA